MSKKFEVRTKDGKSHYTNSRLKWWYIRLTNIGNMYYITRNY